MKRRQDSEKSEHKRAENEINKNFSIKIKRFRIRNVHLVTIFLSIIGLVLTFWLADPISATPTQGYFENIEAMVITAPIIFVFLSSLLLLLLLGIDKVDFIPKLLVIGFGMGIVVPVVVILIPTFLNIMEIPQELAVEIVLSIMTIIAGSVASLTIITPRYLGISNKTSTAAAIAFLSPFIPFSIMTPYNLIHIKGLFVNTLYGYFFAVFLIIFIRGWLIRNEFVHCHDCGNFRVVDIDRRMDQKKEYTESKFKIIAENLEDGNMHTLYPKTGRSVFQADNLEIGDEFKCYFMIRKFKSGEVIYLIRELEFS